MKKLIIIPDRLHEPDKIGLVSITHNNKKLKLNPIYMNDCIYPDWEGSVSKGKHNFGKDGFCIICGKTKEQV